MPHLRAVILTAISTEFKAVRALLTNSQRVKHPEGNIYEQGTFTANQRTWAIGIAEIGKGDPTAASQTERAITFFKPHVILFVGVAGGMKDVKLGDVVASTKIYGYESGKAAETFKTRPEIGLSSFALEEEAKAEVRSDAQAWLKRLANTPDVVPRAWVGPIAAGEKVISSKKSSVYRFLKAEYSDSLAVEMEGYGFLQTVQKRQQPVSAMVVRGISDLIDGKNDDPNQPPEDVRQATASHHASAFAFQILANFEPNVGLLGSQTPTYQVAADSWEQVFSSFSDSDVPRVAPLCRQIFEEVLTAEKVAFAYPEFAQLETVQGLKQLLTRADDLSLAVTWIGRVIEEFKYPSDGAEVRPVPAKLQAWYDDHRPVEPEPEPQEKSPGYLLVTLEPKDDEDTVAIRAEFDDGTGHVTTDLLPPDAQCSLDDPNDTLSKHLSVAVGKAKGVKTIEFFLSWRHFDRPVHEWKVKAGLGKPKELKQFRNTVVRSLDRLILEDFSDEWLECLQNKLIRLRKCCDQELLTLSHPVTDLDFEALAEDLPEGCDTLILKLLTALPDDHEDLEQLMATVLWSGIPLWFWSYGAPADTTKLLDHIDTLLRASYLKDSATFAEVIRKERTRLPDLGLLCDCPHRLPVLVDWKNGRLRQPTA
ncbi:phosphorylase family protein [Leptothoe spongobia]|uniref:5'-methylthioadenosine/S-adenosylhomocysteine nucleosidase n=1 Tax=Leptothoe spongobia TAU-MAC 1115 TaxID=1967444 RepID=A0A947DI68_9CYAN|nr:5'-methylthioadenosine/S-adenosylhomocysteine nucleosidase [Leptothoe spongobia]MBT9317480.1 5'-methylthioadenosine/S-adenosylhomocysteine nucleosidase [Leptothoe spongobia TAU-MAC 1115]